MSRPITVVFAGDEGYAPPLAAAMESVCGNVDKTRDCRIFVLDLGLSEESRQRLRSIGSGPDRAVEIEFVPIDRRSLPVECARPSLASAFGKLQLADVLPAECRRAVFLDADVIVRDDVGVLHDAELDSRPLGACRHCWLINGHAGLERSGHQRSPYFNSGVMVIDLEQWRAERIGEKACALAASDGFMFNDQDALNVLLESRWQPLAHRWNVLYLQMDPPLVRRELLRLSSDAFGEADLDEMEHNPGVVHFGIPTSVGPAVLLAAGGAFSKPWSYWSSHPERERFLEYLDRTPWRGCRASAQTVADAAAVEIQEAVVRQGAAYGEKLAKALQAPSFADQVRQALDRPPPGLEAAIRFFVSRRNGAGPGSPRGMGPALVDVLADGGDEVAESVAYLARFCAEVARARPDFDVAGFAVDAAARMSQRAT